MKNYVIGQYTDAFIPVIDGVVITVKNYAYWLNKECCTCYVATPEVPGYQDDTPFEVIRFDSIPIPKQPPYRWGLPYLDSDFVLRQRELYPDLVHAHSPFATGREALRVARARHIPLIATFHSKYYDDFLQATGSEFIASLVVDNIIGFYNQADCVWTVNSGTAGTLRDYGFKGRIEIMPNGTDCPLPLDREAARKRVNERFALSSDDKVMLYVGQHVLQKNLRKILQGAALYRNAGGMFKLLFVGQGYATQELKALSEQLALTDRVIFCGPEYDRSKLAEIYTRADLFTFPSMYDNAPLVVREASAASCPSLMVRGSNAAESAVDSVNAFLCEDSAQSIAEAMKRAFENETLLKEVGEQARLTLVRSWQSVVADVYAKYDELIVEYREKHPPLQELLRKRAILIERRAKLVFKQHTHSIVEKVSAGQEKSRSIRAKIRKSK